jgi:hypothetical protein
MPDTIADLIATIQQDGFLLNNLFQRDDGLWQANLRPANPERAGVGQAFAVAASPQAALTQVIAACPVVADNKTAAPRRLVIVKRKVNTMV